MIDLADLPDAAQSVIEQADVAAASHLAAQFEGLLVKHTTATAVLAAAILVKKISNSPSVVNFADDIPLIVGQLVITRLSTTALQ